jgi:hypothetical protein
MAPIPTAGHPNRQARGCSFGDADGVIA